MAEIEQMTVEQTVAAARDTVNLLMILLYGAARDAGGLLLTTDEMAYISTGMQENKIHLEITHRADGKMAVYARVGPTPTHSEEEEV